MAAIASNPSTAVIEPMITETSSLVVLAVGVTVAFVDPEFVVSAFLNTTNSIVMPWSVPMTLQVYVPLSVVWRASPCEGAGLPDYHYQMVLDWRWLM